MSQLSIPCPYCGGRAAYCKSSAHIYRGADYGAVYDCRPCDAFVGVHRGSTRSKGTPANRETREARKRAHAAFDAIWRGNRRVSRSKAYARLARCMSLSANECHIGMFDVERCEEVVRVVAEWMAHKKGGSKYNPAHESAV